MSDLVRSQTDLLVLSVLQSGPAHGYAVIESIKRRSKGEFGLPEGTVYPVLHRLETQGLLASDWDLVDGRRRRVYRLTAPGLAAAQERREDWGRFAKAMRLVVGGEA